jgi:hypothetical protein
VYDRLEARNWGTTSGTLREGSSFSNSLLVVFYHLVLLIRIENLPHNFVGLVSVAKRKRSLLKSIRNYYCPVNIREQRHEG